MRWLLWRGTTGSDGDVANGHDVEWTGRCGNGCGFNWITLSAMQLVFFVIAAIVSAVLTTQSYSTVPSPYWVLIGGVNSSSAMAKVRTGLPTTTSTSATSTSTSTSTSLTSDPVVFTVYSDPSNPTQSLVHESIISSASATDSSEYVHTVHIGNLESNAQYYYSLYHHNDNTADPSAGAAALPTVVGSFRTPGLEGESFNFRVVAAGCAWTGSTSHVFSQMAQEEPLLMVHIGDLHYADISSSDLGLRIHPIDQVLGSSQQRTLLSKVALAYMWDDHDWLGNDSNGEPLSAGREAALQSYLMAFPHYTPLPDNTALSLSNSSSTTTSTLLPQNSLPSPYQAFTIGRVRFILLDLRSQSTNISIYSVEQKLWLFQELDAAINYDFVVLVSSKPWINNENLTPADDDSWAAYPANRSELSSYISVNMTKKNLLMVASDAHMVAYDDGSNTYYGNANFDGKELFDDENRSSISSFPLLQTGPMDRLGSNKGGPFSDGCYTLRYERTHQYSVIDFHSEEYDDGGNGSLPCITITAKDDSDRVILSRTLCGPDIFHESAPGIGSCSSAKFSTPTTALLSASCALLVITSGMAMYYLGCGSGWKITFLTFLLTAATLGVGIGIPLAKGIKQFDTNAIAAVVCAQVIAVFLYVIMWSRMNPKTRRTN